MELSPAQAEAFRLYAEQLLDEGERANLTALRRRDLIERRHFAESLALLARLEALGAIGSPVIDIGTGAGFPGLPMKIVRPWLELTLLEATRKKVHFLERLIARLQLTGVNVVQARAEELGHDLGHRESYALALARAVAPLRILAELALPFLQLGGYLAAPKGSGAAREVREAATALAACGGEVERVEPLEVAGAGAAPTLVLVRKASITPEPFPRRPGIPVKRPL